MKHYSIDALERHVEEVRVALRDEDDEETCSALREELRLTEAAIERQRRAWILELSRDERYCEAGASGGEPDDRLRRGGDVDRALRVLDRSAELSAAAVDRLDRLVRRDGRGALARYVAAVADEEYASAWFTILAHPRDAHLRLSPAEYHALLTVNRIVAERALSEGIPGGGYAVPFTLDPTLIFTSDKAADPLRALCRVESGFTKTWKGVATEGVSASFAAEGDEVGDGTPTLAQPTCDAERAHAFVPFSIELEGDWPGIARELARAFTEAKDAVEAAAFTLGDGVAPNPIGIVTAVAAYDGGSSLVSTDGSGAFAVGDLWSLKAALPARYVPTSGLLANPTILDKTFRFGAPNGSEAIVMPDRAGPVFGRPAYESSAMDSATTAGKQIVLYGDFSRFLIYDRIGMQVDLVPHLVGANHRPTGQRGVYAYWRTGTALLDGNAFRLLKVKA